MNAKSTIHGLAELHRTFDLSDFFHGIDDPAIDAQMRTLRADVRAFTGNHRKKLSSYDPAVFFDAFKEYERLIEEADRIRAFASLVIGARTTRHNVARLKKIDRWYYRHIEKGLYWFRDEIARMPADQYTFLSRSGSMSPARKAFATDARKLRRYIRTPSKERRIIEHELAISQAREEWEVALARARVRVRHDGRVRLLTIDQAKHELKDPDRYRREEVANALADTFAALEPTIAGHYNTILKHTVAVNEIRVFRKPETRFCLDNRLERRVMPALTSAILANNRLPARYYDLKRQMLGMPPSRFSFKDIFAALGERQEIPFGEAQNIVIATTSWFSKNLGDEVRWMFSLPKQIVDPEPRPNKFIGAYAESVIAAALGRISLHYQGDYASVKTLMHEVWHLLQMWLSRKHGPHAHEISTILVEWPSTFGELLIDGWFIEHARSDAQRLQLQNGRLEEGIESIWLPAGMYLFEHDAYSLFRKTGELAPHDITRLWAKSQNLVLDNGLKLGRLGALWWVHKAHLATPFESSPNYPASLSGSNLAYGLWRYRGGKKIVRTVEDTIAAGDTVTFSDVMDQFGLDVTDSHSWERCYTPLWRAFWNARRLHTRLFS